MRGTIAKSLAVFGIIFIATGLWLSNKPLGTLAAAERLYIANYVKQVEPAAPAVLQAPDPNAQIVLEEVFSGFTNKPAALTYADDGSGRLYVVDQRGEIWFIENHQNTPKTHFLDIRDRVGCCDEQSGLFSLVFPTDFASKQHFYLFYTNKGNRPGEPDAPDHIIISRFHLLPNANIADPDSEEKVLEIELIAKGFEHKGGQLAFGPNDGYLYITVGDSGKGAAAQDLGSLLGKILRIDVETGNPATYTVPADNPFVDTPGARSEIWALGLRNPWRASFDRLTGDLFISDVGLDTFEEISFQAANSSGGLNFGWRCREGTAVQNTQNECSDPSFEDPVQPPVSDPIVLIAHPPSGGIAVIGGFVYRGSMYPGLTGHYFYSDVGSGKIWSVYKIGPDSWSTPKLQLDTELKPHTFGEDENGELYVLGINNKIYRLADINGSGSNLSTSSKSVSTTHADPDEQITYTIELINTGGQTSQTASIVDTIPFGLSYVANSLSASHGTVDDSQAPDLHWQGSLDTTTNITITYDVTVSASSGTFINQAVVSGADVNPPILSENLIVPRPGPDTTTVRDFQMPGTQPEQLVHEIADPTICGGCHTAPIYETWRGSMMSHAARDPLMWSALFIANNDVPNVGDFCLRCHAPKAWLEGRSHPPDGSALSETDINSGVACEVCHRLIDPIPSTSDQAVTIDAGIRSALTTTMPSDYVGTALMILDPEDRRRGPFDLPIEPPHPISPTLHTDFFDQDGDHVTRARMCGTCHNVDNPGFSWDTTRGQYWPNEIDEPASSFERGDIFPIERTFEEWRNSSYANGVFAPQFAGAKSDGIVGACQDCHMPRTTGLAADAGEPVNRDCQTTGCIPAHEFFGGNTWVPQLLKDSRWRLSSNDTALLDNTTANARTFLQKSASLAVDLQLDNGAKTATVRVTNETGHKLPTGYPEGRRMWLNLKAFDSADNLVYESGKYNADTAVLDLGDSNIKVYEAKLGITPELAAELNLADLPNGGESFHFALNNVILKDNRIPPRGFTVAAFDQPGMRPIGATYADGQHWDDTAYSVPAEAVRVEASLYYQTSSKEYIDFLRANGGADGNTLGLMWDDLKSPPELMASAVATYTLLPSPSPTPTNTSTPSPTPTHTPTPTTAPTLDGFLLHLPLIVR